MGRTPLIASLAILALLLSAGKTHATSTAIGSGSALIDWSSLTFTGIPISFVSQSSNSTGSIGFPGVFLSDSQTVSSWTDTSVSLSAPLGLAEGMAHTTDTELLSQGTVFLGSDPQDSLSNTRFERFGTFLAQQTGLLTVSAQVSVVGEALFPAVTVDSGLALRLVDPTTGRPIGESILDDANAGFHFQGMGSKRQDGILSISYLFDQGQTGLLWASGQTVVTAVPEPDTLLLFGVGLVGLVAWQWRRNQVKTAS